VGFLADGDTAGEVLNHPRHYAAQKSLTEMIRQLRECSNIEDGYIFQRALADHILAVETDRNALSQAVKRLRVGKSPQPGAPEPQSSLDPATIWAWQLERDICERIGRQYRCVGDALAWRVFGFQRKHIIARAQNAPPGIWAGKVGLARELEAVEEARANGHFAILHDLTNCLRIGDVTVFTDDGFETREVKSDPDRRSPAQLRRIRAADAAVRDGGPLPGTDRRARLFDVNVQFKTHLNVLRLGADRAFTDGFFTAKLPGDRVLMVSDLYGYSIQKQGEDEWAERLERKHTAALRRAGIGTDRTWNIHATSMDNVSRDPARVPFAAYPLNPATCARIIGDLTIFHVETSSAALEESVRAAGIEAEWVRPPGGRELAPGEVLMNMISRVRSPAPAAVSAAMHRGPLTMEHVSTLQLRRSGLDQYLVEMIDQDIWIEGIRYMLANNQLDGRVWPHYRGEYRVWC
jgi:hypothetical protein